MDEYTDEIATTGKRAGLLIVRRGPARACVLDRPDLRKLALQTDQRHWHGGIDLSDHRASSVLIERGLIDVARTPCTAIAAPSDAGVAWAQHWLAEMEAVR